MGIFSIDEASGCSMFTTYMGMDQENTPKGDTVGAISAPDIGPALKPRTRAIRDAKQARAIITTLETASRERNIKNARIMDKYNSEKPYAQSALEQDGLGWKSNFTTKPLPMLIDKVAPRFVKVLDNVKYLTNSSLPDDEPGNALKTEAFRRDVTQTIRARPGWTNFISEVAQENALFGYTSVAWLDEYSWFPKHFRQDSFFVPTGTRQLARFAQVIALRETFLIHELFDLISDREAAESSGWDIQNTVFALNNAMPEDRRSRYADWERVYSDLVRESSVGLSHEAGARVVVVWHLLATEATGKVSHYILTESGVGNEKSQNGYEDEPIKKDRDVLFEREDQFESMSDAAAFFSFQIGNGKLHGSKGIGREIYSMAAMLDRARNEVVDRLNLMGKIIIQADDKALRRFKMSVVGNALLIGQGYVISERKLDAGVEPFLELDKFLTSLLDQMAGATTPKAFEGERVTKAAVDLFASREEETRDNIIGRFLGQFADLMTTMQRRLCDPHTSETDAKEMQKRLLKIMSREELNKLAEQPVAETIKDYTELERQKVIIIAQEGRGNPLYNQRELERRKITAQIDEEFANAVLLPEEDPTIVAEQSRLQNLELLILVGQGSPVPVSPRDNHLVHLQVLQPAMEAAAAETATKGVEGLQILHNLFKHASDHYALAEQNGTPKETLAPIKKFLTQLDSAIKRLDQMETQNQREQGIGPAPQPAAPGQPPAPPPAAPGV